MRPNELGGQTLEGHREVQSALIALTLHGVPTEDINRLNDAVAAPNGQPLVTLDSGVSYTFTNGLLCLSGEQLELDSADTALVMGAMKAVTNGKEVADRDARRKMRSLVWQNRYPGISSILRLL